jgi:hypothetical protein
MLSKVIVSVAIIAVLSYGAAAFSQSGQAFKANCDKDANAAAPLTKPKDGPQSGSAPGNMGSTGWTGGTGGSHIGIADEHSASNPGQPETAKGLDPTKPDTGEHRSPC